jgi:hypothetical protein
VSSCGRKELHRGDCSIPASPLSTVQCPNWVILRNREVASHCPLCDLVQTICHSALKILMSKITPLFLLPICYFLAFYSDAIENSIKKSNYYKRFLFTLSCPKDGSRCPTGLMRAVSAHDSINEGHALASSAVMMRRGNWYGPTPAASMPRRSSFAAHRVRFCVHGFRRERLPVPWRQSRGCPTGQR